jgi:hypothetical protein
VVWTGYFDKFLKMVLRLLHLMIEITLDNRDILLTRVINFLVITIIAGRNGDAQGHRFYPFLPSLTPFLAPLMAAFDGVGQPSLATAFTLPRTNAAPPPPR